MNVFILHNLMPTKTGERELKLGKTGLKVMLKQNKVKFKLKLLQDLKTLMRAEEYKDSKITSQSGHLEIRKQNIISQAEEDIKLDKTRNHQRKS